MYIFFIHRVELYKFITEKFARSRVFVKRENRTCVGSVFLSVCLCLSMWRMPQLVLLNSHQGVAKRMDSSSTSESKPTPAGTHSEGRERLSKIVFDGAIDMLTKQFFNNHFSEGKQF